MTNVTIIGATGSLGLRLTKLLLENPEIHLTLFSRSIRPTLEDRVRTIAASVYDQVELEKAVQDANLVFVALSGELDAMVGKIIAAMKQVGTNRIVFIASYGIYGELPGQNGQVASVLAPYRAAADLLEASDLDYTILRPGWFDNSPDTRYRLIPKGDTIFENQISRQAIAEFVNEIVQDLSLYSRENLGIVRP